MVIVIFSRFALLVYVFCKELCENIFTLLLLLGLRNFCLSVLTCSLESDFPCLVGDSDLVVCFLHEGMELVDYVEWITTCNKA